MNDTTYCHRHERLEHVEAVEATKPAPIEYANGTTGPGGIVCEVIATTETGCRLHFMGGPDWSLVDAER